MAVKIVIDREIPFIEGVLEPWADVLYKDGSSIEHDDLVDADALITRTRTNCNSELLDGTSIKMIATNTIGTDNIDHQWCKDHGIFVRNAAGCNAGGVMNYIFSALYGCAARKSISLQGATFGILGCGSTGGRVAQTARLLGLKTMIYDPPRADSEGGSSYYELDDILKAADIISLHLPFNDQTRDIANAEFFAKMKEGAFFINSANGYLCNEQDLIAARKHLGAIIIDTWRNEPYINRELLEKADIATPHIAGYSYQGKQWGTAFAVRAIARFFNIKELFDFYPKTDVLSLEAVKLDLRDKTQGQTASIMQYNYPIFTDDFMFRMNPDDFDNLRSHYRYRREFFIE